MWKLQIQPQYASHNSWEALAVQEELGYEALELSVPPYAGSLDGRRQWYQKSGRLNAIHGAFVDVNPGSSDPDVCALSMRRCHESCSLAKSLGVKHVIFHSSCETFLRGAYLDLWAGRCASFYETLADLYDIQIWLENSQDIDATPLDELMKRIPDPRIGVCLDFGHIHYSRMPMEQWFEILGERVGYLHLSDNNGLYDEHLPLGDGTVNWEAADALWKNTGKKMLLTLETGGIEGAARSVAYLKEHGLFGF